MNPTFKYPYYFYFRNKSPFSNWYVRNFKVRERIFNCVEQYMMWTKAEFFGDIETAKLILAAKTPKEQKALGRQVKGFNRIVWESMVEDVLFTATKAKFTQHKDLAELILSINAKEFVEASPYDGIYGVKLAANDPRIHNKKDWLGLNKAGRVVTRVRNWMYVAKKGKTMSQSHRPEFIVFDLSVTFDACRQLLIHTADADVLLPSIVSNVINCLEERDDNLARLDVYSKDIVEQFKNDGQCDQDGHVVADIVKMVGHALLNEIISINGYDENDSFDYEPVRIEKSGAIYLALRDPVGTKALVEKDTKQDYPIIGVYMVDVDGKPIAGETLSGKTVAYDTDGSVLKDRLEKSAVTRLYMNEEHQRVAENHNHQGHYQGHHTPPTPCQGSSNEVVSLDQQWENYEKHEQSAKLIVEEHVPAAGFRSRTEYDLQEDFTSSTEPVNLLEKIEKIKHREFP